MAIDYRKYNQSINRYQLIPNVNAYYSLLYLQEDVHQALCWTPFLCQLLMKAGVALVLPIPILMQGPHRRNENLCSSFRWTGFCVQPWKQAFWLPWSDFWLIVLQCHWYAAMKQIQNILIIAIMNPASKLNKNNIKFLCLLLIIFYI